jgi:hypothetical protein
MAVVQVRLFGADDLAAPEAPVVIEQNRPWLTRGCSVCNAGRGSSKRRRADPGRQYGPAADALR